MPKLLRTCSRHSAETEELLRSFFDLIHCDCYTNGINKGKIAILNQNCPPLHWQTLSPFSSSYMEAHWVCVWTCVCPHHVMAIRSSLFSRLGVQCCWIATFCTVKNNNMSFEIWHPAISNRLTTLFHSPAGPDEIPWPNVTLSQHIWIKTLYIHSAVK